MKQLKNSYPCNKKGKDFPYVYDRANRDYEIFIHVEVKMTLDSSHELNRS